MPELDHTFGDDLTLSGDGSVATTSGAAMITQRLLRRLCTNPGAYLWDLEYGAGLPAMVGSPVETTVVEGVILAQIAMEDGVADDPAPEVSTRYDASGGFLYATVTYWATSGGNPITLQVPEGTTNG